MNAQKKVRKPLGPRTLLIEVRKAERAMSRNDLPADRRSELQATVQALRWAMGDKNIMAPVAAALLGVDR